MNRLIVHVTLVSSSREEIDECYDWLADQDLFGVGAAVLGKDKERLKSAYEGASFLAYEILSDIGLRGPYVQHHATEGKWIDYPARSIMRAVMRNAEDFKNYAEIGKKEIRKKRLEMLRDEKD
jgi:hypothetical protein